jgi:hypothetical protein
LIFDPAIAVGFDTAEMGAILVVRRYESEKNLRETDARLAEIAHEVKRRATLLNDHF